MIPQADRWLPTHILRWIGGARTYGQRLTFYLGMLNTATLMIVLYDSSDVVASVFPTVAHWLVFVGLVAVPAIVAFDYWLVHAAQITYNSHQQSQSNRNPGYALTEENNEMLRRLTNYTDREEEADKDGTEESRREKTAVPLNSSAHGTRADMESQL